MKPSEQIKEFYQITIQSTKLAEEISQKIDDVRLCGIRMEAENMQKSNNEITELSNQLLMLNQKRIAIAECFGVDSQGFFESVITQLPNNTKHTIFRANNRLEFQMNICEKKMTDLQVLLQKQQEIIINATQNMSVNIRA